MRLKLLWHYLWCANCRANGEHWAALRRMP